MDKLIHHEAAAWFIPEAAETNHEEAAKKNIDKLIHHEATGSNHEAAETNHEVVATKHG